MIKWTITKHSKQKCIDDIKSLDEDAKWLVEIKKHNRSEMQNRTEKLLKLKAMKLQLMLGRIVNYILVYLS